ncbi:uncharacterized protein K02A2.6-like [Camellia sinensis]|uniref:uncharacterized protein K02A2.6-like n=1 Tax=Camellia sinensis TaxID=4442 RepID=UPI001035545F|nr:uncharacterized protein K02A2.6-like [Camellia sinensis]
MDMIGKIHSPFLKHHCVMLVATDYFIKWVKAKPYKSIDQTELISFIKDLMYKFGIPQTITIDNGTIFECGLVKAFAGELGISIFKATPYYTQSNGQAKPSNKTIKNGIQKIVEDNPRECHNILLEALWAYRTSKRSSTRVNPSAFVYRHDVVLPMEINVNILIVKAQDCFDKDLYCQNMCMKLEDLDEAKILALNKILIQK